MHAKFGWWVVAGVTGALVVVLGWQLNAMAALRDKYGREKIAIHSLAAVRAEHERLLALQPPAGELERMTAEVATLPQARAEVTELRERAERTVRDAAEKRSAPEARFAAGKTVSAADWKNAGVASPQAALETALWAGAGGDVETFAKTMKFMNGQVRQAAQALLESLPKETRAQYDTPERFIAFLTMCDIPLGSVQVRQFVPLDGSPVPAAQMQVMLRAADGKARDTNLLFMNSGDGWKLLVTEAVVAKYVAMLKDPKIAAGGK